MLSIVVSVALGMVVLGELLVRARGDLCTSTELHGQRGRQHGCWQSVE